ncbi:MAG: hypothetical protein ABII21_01775 [bacterium]
MKDKSVAKPTGKLIRRIGQFLVKNWSAFQGGQNVGKMRADLEPFKAKQGVQKVDKNRTENLRQLFVKTAPIKVHRRFTESSPDFRTLSLKSLRYGDGEMSVVFIPSFVLSPRIAQYMRKVLIQFDIPSSYLYVVVLKKLCL